MDTEETQDPSEENRTSSPLQSIVDEGPCPETIQPAVDIVDVKTEPPDPGDTCFDASNNCHTNIAIDKEILSHESDNLDKTNTVVVNETEQTHPTIMYINAENIVNIPQNHSTLHESESNVKEEMTVVIKQEVDMMCEPDISISYDMPSMNESGEGRADLRSSLQEEVQLKIEVEDYFEGDGQKDDNFEEATVKTESGTTEAKMIFKNIKLTTSGARLSTKRNETTSQYTDEIENARQTHPDSQYTIETNTRMMQDSNFLLNSITGNMLTLEQEAYGLLEAKNATKLGPEEYNFVCPKCPQKYKQRYALTKHLKVHETIERRAEGVARGLQTKQRNKKFNLATIGTSKDTSLVPYDYNLTKEKKVLKRGEFICEKCNKAYRFLLPFKRHQARCSSVAAKPKATPSKELKILPQKDATRDQKTVKNESGDYKCECGNTFSRRSRLETCLRSHNPEAESNSFSCSTCSKSFKEKKELMLHKKRQHTKKKFLCKFCPMDYATPKELFKHLRIHKKVQMMEYKVISEVVEGKQKLQCFICTKTCTEISALKAHVLADHKEPYTCPHCGKNLPKIVDFGTHTKSAHPEVEGQSVLDVLEAFSILAQAWQCEECDLHFEDPDDLVKHQTDQHGPTNKKVENAEEGPKFQFRCEDCRRTFVTLKQLSTHRDVYHTIKNGAEMEEPAPPPPPPRPMCVHCRKICQDEAALTSHLRLHSTERKYPCKFCDFRFSTIEKKKNHSLLHTGDMKFVCFVCEYRCSSENRLNFHKQTQKHLDLKQALLRGPPLEPQPLPEVKKKRHSSEKELSESSDEFSTCDVCGEEFPSESAMAEHKETHPFIVFPNEDQPTRIFFK